MADPTPSSRPVAGEETLYPCITPGCTAMRTKAEGGTTFSVCDDCWGKLYPPKSPAPADVPEYVLRPIRRMWHDAQDEIARLTREQATRTAALDAPREARHGCGIATNAQEPPVRCGIRSRNWSHTPLCSDCTRKAADAISALLGGDDATA